MRLFFFLLFCFSCSPSKPALFVPPEKTVPILFQFDPGFHLNEVAPSRLELKFHDRQFVFERKDLVNEPLLPPLKTGTTASLTGDLYYCEKKDSKVCRIHKVDVQVKTRADASHHLLIDTKRTP